MLLFGTGTVWAATSDICEADPECAKQSEAAAQLAAATEYDKALTAYERIFERWREPRLLMNIGRCHFRLGRARKALASYNATRAEIFDPEPELLQQLNAFTAEAKAAISEDMKTPPAPPTPSTPEAPPKESTADLLADPKQVVPDRCLAFPACRQLSEQAAELAAQTNYEQALAVYLRAYEKRPEPRLLMNIGRCYFRMGRAQKAMEYYLRFRKSNTVVEPEVQERLGPFIVEAKLSIVTEQGITAEGDEPEPEPAALVGGDLEQKTEAAPRPTWRVGLGVGMIGLGVVMAALGGNALSKNGDCATPSTTSPGFCATMVGSGGQRTTNFINGVTPGVPLLIFGGALVIGGIVVAALPGKKQKTAWRLPVLSSGPALAH